MVGPADSEQQSNPHVLDVTESNFEYAVLSGSQSRPVLIDFWSATCAPCLTLSPILESLAAEYDGAFLLAKVNVEQAPHLAMEFQIESLPTLMLVKEGKLVDRAVGAPSETQLRTMLRKHVDSAEDKIAQGGWDLEQSGDLDAAKQAYAQVLEKEDDNAEARLGMARVLLAQLDIDSAAKELDLVDETTTHITQAEWHNDAIEFWREAVQFASAPPPSAGPDADDDTLFQTAAALTAQRRYAEACEVLLALLTRNSGYRKQLPRKSMLSLFGFLGETNPLTREFQDRMASALF